jgi:hypothetical protein
MRLENFIPTVYISNYLQLDKVVDVDLDSYADDFNRRWYLQVGINFMTTFIIMIFNPSFINFFFLLPIKKCWRRYKFRKAIIHRDAKKHSYGPVF